MTASLILVLLTDPSGAPNLLDAAAAAARAVPDPRIDALHVRLDPASTIMPSEQILTPEQGRAIEAASAAQGTELHAAFEEWRAAGNPGNWDEVVGDPAHEMHRRGPAAALIAMTLPAPHPPSAEQAALEAALFGTHRPVLVVPASWQGGFGRHLVVGWRDSPATRHALTALRPWLAAAETITLLTVGDGPAAPPTGPLAGLPGRLTQSVLPPDAAGGDGAALLAAAMDAGADGLAMGAYRRGRVLEWLLGGVTEHVLHHAALPLLLVH
jgi:nucleotide-binding universal stress UspA family protein